MELKPSLSKSRMPFIRCSSPRPFAEIAALAKSVPTVLQSSSGGAGYWSALHGLLADDEVRALYGMTLLPG
jgi:hypothetical protein